MLRASTAPQRLDQWERLIVEAQAGEQGTRDLMDVLLGVGEEHGRLREFSPFPGVLIREERRQARELCGYRH